MTGGTFLSGLGRLFGVRATVLGTSGVVAVNRLAAVYSGTSEVLLDADLDLSEDLDTTQIEVLLDRLEARVRDIVPRLERVRVILNLPGKSGKAAMIERGRNRDVDRTSAV